MAGRAQFEVIIVGAGIAGVSLAYFLAEHGLTDVLLLEREPQLARHATGRSAASLNELDWVPVLRQLKALGAAFLRKPPAGFCEHPLVTGSGLLAVFPQPAWETVESAAPALRAGGITIEVLSHAAALGRVPVLAPDQVAGALFLPEDGRIDVHELLSSYLRHARAHGATLRLGADVRGVRSQGGRCVGVETADAEYRARLVVDAAGAWAGQLAARAGASPIPLVPHRRTIITFGSPDGVDATGWPFVVAESHSLYFTPEPGGFLLSPMDEEAMEPGDIGPDDVVIAAALERLRTLAPRLVPRSLQRRWAGLRTLAPDRVHVVGEDPRLPGFFWLAGQGGCGIETSPIIGEIAADLIVRGRTDRFDPALLSPARFAAA